MSEIQENTDGTKSKVYRLRQSLPSFVFRNREEGMDQIHHHAGMKEPETTGFE